MKTNLIGLAVSAMALTSFSAFADHDDDDGVEVSVGWDDPNPAPCDHDASPVIAPQPAARADGRYELRQTQNWIPARYEQVTVQQCREHHHGGWHHEGREHCYPVTETRLIPGYYQTVQQWVWVPIYPQYQQYSQYPGHRPPMFGQGRVGFRFGTR